MNKARKKSNKTKLKILIAVLPVIISGIFAVIMTAIEKPGSKNSSDSIQVEINQNDHRAIGVGAINGDDVVIKQEESNNISTTIYNETYQNTNNYIQQDYDFENMSEQELSRRAKAACLAESYDDALAIYKYEGLEDNKAALVNLGYIYAKGLSYEGFNYQKAEECYIKANCVEAKRNLLALYLDVREDTNKIDELVNDLLWQEEDKIAWEYMLYTVYDMSVQEYTEEMLEEEFTYEIDSLFQWEYAGHYYDGPTPPMDSTRSRWIATDLNWEEFRSYSVYSEQQVRYSVYIDIMEHLYYEENGELISLDA